MGPIHPVRLTKQVGKASRSASFCLCSSRRMSSRFCISSLHGLGLAPEAKRRREVTPLALLFSPHCCERGDCQDLGQLGRWTEQVGRSGQMMLGHDVSSRCWLNAAFVGVVEEDALRWKRKLWFGPAPRARIAWFCLIASPGVGYYYCISILTSPWRRELCCPM